MFLLRVELGEKHICFEEWRIWFEEIQKKIEVLTSVNLLS
jgi:hypothetical protein